MIYTEEAMIQALNMHGHLTMQHKHLKWQQMSLQPKKQHIYY